MKQRIDILCHILEQVLGQVEKYNGHKTAICHNPHNLSSWDYHIATQLSYKHTCCHGVVPAHARAHIRTCAPTHTHTQNCSSSYICRNIKCLNFGLLWICQASLLYNCVSASYGQQMKMIWTLHSSTNFSNYPAHGTSSNAQVIHKYCTYQPSPH